MPENMIIEVERDETHKCPFNDDYDCFVGGVHRGCGKFAPADCPLLKGDVTVRMKEK